MSFIGSSGCQPFAKAHYYSVSCCCTYVRSRPPFITISAQYLTISSLLSSSSAGSHGCAGYRAPGSASHPSPCSPGPSRGMTAGATATRNSTTPASAPRFRRKRPRPGSVAGSPGRRIDRHNHTDTESPPSAEDFLHSEGLLETGYRCCH